MSVTGQMQSRPCSWALDTRPATCETTAACAEWRIEKRAPEASACVRGVSWTVDLFRPQRFRRPAGLPKGSSTATPCREGQAGNSYPGWAIKSPHERAGEHIIQSGSLVSPSYAPMWAFRTRPIAVNIRRAAYVCSCVELVTGQLPGTDCRESTSKPLPQRARSVLTGRSREGSFTAPKEFVASFGVE
jgi:hypothetical protein